MINKVIKINKKTLEDIKKISKIERRSVTSQISYILENWVKLQDNPTESIKQEDEESINYLDYS